MMRGKGRTDLTIRAGQQPGKVGQGPSKARQETRQSLSTMASSGGGEVVINVGLKSRATDQGGTK